jgi:hypothetical protein
MLLAVALAAALPVAGALQVVNPPSGRYKQLYTNELYEYDNATGGLGGTGQVEPSLCVGNAEARIFVAGLCVDIDPISTSIGAGYDAKGLATLVGDWHVWGRVTVQGRDYPTCVPACYGDAIPGVTYYEWRVINSNACRDFPAARELQATAAMHARDPDGGVTFIASEDLVIPCPAINTN